MRLNLCLLYFNSIQKAVNQGFVQQGVSSAADKNIKIALDNYFCDSNKIGLGFSLKFDDEKLLIGNIECIDLSYKIKNGDGEYVFGTSGENLYTSNSIRPKPVLDLPNKEIKYDMLIESVTGTIPKLQNAVIEVKSISTSTSNRIDVLSFPLLH